MVIKKLFLETAYLKTLQQFYGSLLELNVHVINDRQISVAIGESELVFAEGTTGEPFYHFAINIPANKIEEAKTWLSPKVKLLWMDDYKSEIADFVNWHAKSVYFYDPAGNIVELIARFDLSNEATSAFSAKHFLSISEIGLVFKREKFDEEVSKLLEHYSLPYFSKQPPLPQFKAIGDDDGLFIVVPEERNWYPTDKPAGIFPLTVEFQNAGRNIAILDILGAKDSRKN